MDGAGLGLRMQDTNECSSSERSVMVMSCHHKPPARELSSSCSGGGGPTIYRASNHVACFGGINDVLAYMSAITGAVAVTKSLRYPYSSSDSSLFTFNSSGKISSSFRFTCFLP